MTRSIILAFFLCLLPFKLAADWRIGPGSEIFDGTSSAFGVTDKGVGALGVMCLDDKPFVWTQGWAPAKAGADRPENFTIEVDGRAFTVAGRHTPPDGMWTGTPPPGLLDALKAGSAAAILAPGQGRVGVSLRGSSRSISTVMDRCGEGAAPAAAPAASAGRIVLFGQLIATVCGGGYSLAEGAEFTGRLDSDDKPDIVLDWAGVTCDDRSKGRGAGFCGAALCAVEIAFTETQGRQQLLGLNPRLVDRAFGLKALQTTTQGATCGGPAMACDVTWVWNGTKLEPVE